MTERAPIIDDRFSESYFWRQSSISKSETAQLGQQSLPAMPEGPLWSNKQILPESEELLEDDIDLRHVPEAPIVGRPDLQWPPPDPNAAERTTSRESGERSRPRSGSCRADLQLDAAGTPGSAGSTRVRVAATPATLEPPPTQSPMVSSILNWARSERTPAATPVVQVEAPPTPLAQPVFEPPAALAPPPPMEPPAALAPEVVIASPPPVAQPPAGVASPVNLMSPASTRLSFSERASPGEGSVASPEFFRTAPPSPPPVLVLAVADGKGEREGARRQRALAALALLGLTATVAGCVVMTRRLRGRAEAGSWSIDFASADPFAPPDWRWSDSIGGAGGGLQWFRPANARRQRGSLALEARPTWEVALPGESGSMGYRRALGCGRATAAQALGGCADGSSFNLELGSSCAADVLAARCNASAGLAAAKGKGLPTVLPPATSARFYAAHPSGRGIITHGRLELRVRLPIGEWLRPFVHLLPARLGDAAAQAADGLDVAALRLLDSRGNDCADFKDKLSAQTLASSIQWGPSAAARAAPAAVGLWSAAHGGLLGHTFLTIGLERSATRLRTFVRDGHGLKPSEEATVLNVEIRPLPRLLNVETARARGDGRRELCVTAPPAAESCTPLEPTAGKRLSGTLDGLFNAPLALVVGLAVGSGGASAAAAADNYWAGNELGNGECSKPWTDGADAAARFYAAHGRWGPTWLRPRLEIERIDFAELPTAGGDVAAAGGGAQQRAPASGRARPSPSPPSPPAPPPSPPPKPVEMSVSDLAAANDATTAPEVLSIYEAHVCAICHSHRCDSTDANSCGGRNKNFARPTSNPSASEQWACLCACCSAHCGVQRSCAASPRIPQPISYLRRKPTGA